MTRAIRKLDHSHENWLNTSALARLRARGWTGTVDQWSEQYKRTGRDPLDSADPAPTERAARHLLARLTRDQALEIAEAFILEEGDLPESVWYQLGLQQEDQADGVIVWESLTALREAYFAELGEDMPPYTGTWR